MTSRWQGFDVWRRALLVTSAAIAVMGATSALADYPEPTTNTSNPIRRIRPNA